MPWLNDPDWELSPTFFKYFSTKDDDGKIDCDEVVHFFSDRLSPRIAPCVACAMAGSSNGASGIIEGRPYIRACRGRCFKRHVPIGQIVYWLNKYTDGRVYREQTEDLEKYPSGSYFKNLSFKPPSEDSDHYSYSDSDSD
jgi:hypothetical protein